MSQVARAKEIFRLAVEFDQGTLTGSDSFEQLLTENVPLEQIHRWFNLNQPLVQEVIKDAPMGRTSMLAKQVIEMLSDPNGSHGYNQDTALKINGLEDLL